MFFIVSVTFTRRAKCFELFTSLLDGQRSVFNWLRHFIKPDFFENATFFLRIGLPSTRKRWKRSPKTELFEDALQSGTFRKRGFPVLVWTEKSLKTELFENADVTPSFPGYFTARNFQHGGQPSHCSFSITSSDFKLSRVFSTLYCIVKYPGWLHEEKA